jgi:predicted RNase H-like HicB family nuclease
MELQVRAMWDAEASVWVAESEDVPGLITEADSFEALLRKLRVMIPELLEANGALPPNGDEFPYSLSVQDRAYRHAA